MAGWQTRPVFVSSTFRDMQSERDWLRERVFPELEERLRKRRAHLEVVDLRWGVDAASEGEAQAREELVLKVCLEEVRRCRPFLVVLLGDRYGWVPPPERMRAAVQEAGFATEVGGKSVTALEIEFGVLAGPEQRRRTRFYFRERLPCDRMRPEVAAAYSEAYGEGQEARQRQERLAALKARIEGDERWRGRVRHYTAQWDKQRERVTGLDEFGAMVLEDLWADLQEEIPPAAEGAVMSWREEERAEFEQFVAQRERDFRGREELTAELVSFALDGDGQWALSLTGEAGSGKSALLAHVYRRLQERAAVVLGHAAGISPRSTSVQGMLLRFIEELAAVAGEAMPVGEDASAEEAEQAFAGLLGRVARRRRVVVLVDALNQFEATARARHLTWLPKLWPENARLIASAIPGAASAGLEGRAGVRAVALPALTEAEAAGIARGVCGRYHRTLNPGVLGVLLAKRTRAGERSAGNPLWLELALEGLNLLDQDDFARLGEFRGTEEERLLALLTDVAGRMPGDIEELYGWLLAQSEQTWGEAWTREFAGLIAVSRAGWREADFARLLPARTGEGWEPLRFAGLRRSFRAHLMRRGAQGQWDFFHAQARAAVRARYVADRSREREVHEALAGHLAALPAEDALHESELMYHLIGADAQGPAAVYYGSAWLTAGEKAGATARLAEHIIAGAGEGEEGGPGLGWALGLLGQKLAPGDLGRLCHRFIFDLRDALENETRLGVKRRLLQRTGEVLQRLAAADPSNTDWQRDLAASYERLGDVRRAQGDLTGALRACESGLAIRQRLAAGDPSNADRQRDLSVSYNRLGDVRRAQGDLAGALRAYEAGLAIRQRLAAGDPSNADWQRDLAVSYNKVGDVRMAQGDLAGALREYQTAMGTAQRLAAGAPSNAEWQRDLSVSYNKVGDVSLAQRDLAGALRAYQAGLAIAQRLATGNPSNAEWQRDLSVSYNKMGDVRLSQKDLAGALRAYEAGLGIRQRLAAADPSNADWQRDLSASHSKVGDVRLAQRDLAGALREYGKAMAIRQRLAAADPSTAQWQRDPSVSHSKVGGVRLAQGDLAGALREYEEAMAIRQRLAAGDPSSVQWQRDLSMSRNKMGDVRLAQGDLAGALREYEAELAVRQRLAAADPSNAQRQQDLSVSHLKVASVFARTGNTKAEQSHLRQVRDILRAMKAKGMHLDPQAEKILAQLESLRL